MNWDELILSSPVEQVFRNNPTIVSLYVSKKWSTAKNYVRNGHSNINGTFVYLKFLTQTRTIVFGKVMFISGWNQLHRSETRIVTTYLLLLNRSTDCIPYTQYTHAHYDPCLMHWWTCSCIYTLFFLILFLFLWLHERGGGNGKGVSLW